MKIPTLYDLEKFKKDTEERKRLGVTDEDEWE